MVLDYSKWDALELSDDSDIEVHPNVDKRSFIRAKQNQIHMEREQRRHEIKTLKYEKVINEELLSRIRLLLERLRDGQGKGCNPDEVVFKVILSVAADAKDAPPAPPEGVHANIKEHQKYSQMLSSLADQVKKELEEKKTEDTYAGYIAGVEEHMAKVEDLQSQLLTRLQELEKIESSKITSDSIHTGFDTSFITKADAGKKSSEKKKKPARKGETVELLNPGAGASSASTLEESDDQADDEKDDEEGNPDDLKVTPLAKEFAKIKLGDYNATRDFIMKHKTKLLKERKTDELLMEAFDALMSGDEDYGRQCVHQGLLLQYCRSLGPDGIPLFFKRITTPGHRAGILFRDDVNDTFSKIRTRAKEIVKASANANEQGEVEQIQLHAVDPSTTLNIVIPPLDSTDLEDAAAIATFKSFSPEMQKALQSKSLEEVNVVLGRMKVAEAEEVVEKLGDSGILSVEQGIVDATTEEGKKWLSELEKKDPAADGPSEEPMIEERTKLVDEID
ncbi:hsp90 co-chaperone Cdc37 [Ascosphaera aggregata]|nr:hsp90 co-chaperone Cdc37 [Ascosphaera aggregata]